MRDSGSAAVVLTISSKLSGTYQSACAIAAADYDNVYVVDSGTAAIGTYWRVCPDLHRPGHGCCRPGGS